MTPTTNQINGVIRVLVPVVLTFVTAKGFLTETQAVMLGPYAEAMIVSAVALIFAAWSLRSNTVPAMVEQVSKADTETIAEAKPEDKSRVMNKLSLASKLTR